MAPPGAVIAATPGLVEIAILAGIVLVVVAAVVAVVAIGWGLYRGTRSRDSADRDSS